MDSLAGRPLRTLADRRLRTLAVGDSRARRRLVLTVVGLLGAGSVAFLLELHEGHRRRGTHSTMSTATNAP
ncbi:hypothetical protein HZS55_07340 [Halosimplex rubrum]|uniref:Uncharacterized protein n=1 Tax=Halosimplex rubrum TaxID=869889 RepID=A0A7D5P9N6_9EURY|nr:hypothetical protein [Halosimplex rubrum]QLH77119.1 hypothetical protein HZS55_07340 [Halosimplex rubrum]